MIKKSDGFIKNNKKLQEFLISCNLDVYKRQGLKNTIVVATHDLDLAYEFSERTIILNKGKMIFDGSTKTILKDKDFLEANNLSLPLMFRKL